MSRMSKAEAEALVGRRIRKEFANGWFEGVVAAYNSKRRWYHIKYKDGDDEHLGPAETRSLLLPNTSRGASTPQQLVAEMVGRRVRKRVKDGDLEGVIGDYSSRKRQFHVMYEDGTEDFLSSKASHSMLVPGNSKPVIPGQAPDLMGRKVRVKFDSDWFVGVIDRDSAKRGCIHVTYEDGDAEDMSIAEARQVLLPEPKKAGKTPHSKTHEASAIGSSRSSSGQQPAAGGGAGSSKSKEGLAVPGSDKPAKTPAADKGKQAAVPVVPQPEPQTPERSTRQNASAKEQPHSPPGNTELRMLLGPGIRQRPASTGRTQPPQATKELLTPERRTMQSVPTKEEQQSPPGNTELRMLLGPGVRQRPASTSKSKPAQATSKELPTPEHSSARQSLSDKDPQELPAGSTELRMLLGPGVRQRPAFTTTTQPPQATKEESQTSPAGKRRPVSEAGMEQQMPMRNTRHNVSAPAADSEVQLPARQVRQSSPTPDKEQQGAAEGGPQLVKVVDRGLKSPGADSVQEARAASTKQTLPPESVQQAATPTGSKEPELPQSATDTQALRGARQARAPAAAKAQLPESAEEGAPGTSKELQPPRPETHLEPLQPPPGGGHLPDAGAAPQSPGYYAGTAVPLPGGATPQMVRESSREPGSSAPGQTDQLPKAGPEPALPQPDAAHHPAEPGPDKPAADCSNDARSSMPGQDPNLQGARKDMQAPAVHGAQVLPTHALEPNQPDSSADQLRSAAQQEPRLTGAGAEQQHAEPVEGQLLPMAEREQKQHRQKQQDTAHKKDQQPSATTKQGGSPDAVGSPQEASTAVPRASGKDTTNAAAAPSAPSAAPLKFVAGRWSGAPDLIGKQVRVPFEEGWYIGVIDGYSARRGWVHITYQDGDDENMNAKEARARLWQEGNEAEYSQAPPPEAGPAKAAGPKKRRGRRPGAADKAAAVGGDAATQERQLRGTDSKPTLRAPKRSKLEDDSAASLPDGPVPPKKKMGRPFGSKNRARSLTMVKRSSSRRSTSADPASAAGLGEVAPPKKRMGRPPGSKTGISLERVNPPLSGRRGRVTRSPANPETAGPSRGRGRQALEKVLKRRPGRPLGSKNKAKLPIKRGPGRPPGSKTGAKQPRVQKRRGKKQLAAEEVEEEAGKEEEEGKGDEEKKEEDEQPARRRMGRPPGSKTKSKIARRKEKSSQEAERTEPRPSALDALMQATAMASPAAPKVRSQGPVNCRCGAGMASFAMPFGSTTPIWCKNCPDRPSEAVKVLVHHHSRSMPSPAAASEPSQPDGPHIGAALVGSRVKKRFGHVWHEGVIDDRAAQPGWLHVTYEDGGTEEVSLTEAREILLPEPCAQTAVAPPQPPQTKSPPTESGSKQKRPRAHSPQLRWGAKKIRSGLVHPAEPSFEHDSAFLAPLMAALEEAAASDDY